MDELDELYGEKYDAQGRRLAAIWDGGVSGEGGYVRTRDGERGEVSGVSRSSGVAFKYHLLILGEKPLFARFSRLQVEGRLQGQAHGLEESGAADGAAEAQGISRRILGPHFGV